MSIDLTDNDIANLISEKKKLPDDYNNRLMRFQDKMGHKRSELGIIGANGGEFKILIRQGIINPLDFSVILAYKLPNSTRYFRLRRYNGKHRHNNSIEGKDFYDTHIHQATERYQDIGSDEEKFAEESDRFNNVATALKCMLGDCGFELPDSEKSQISLELDQ